MTRRLLPTLALLWTTACGGSNGSQCKSDQDCSSHYCAYSPDQTCLQSGCEGTCACPPTFDGGSCG